MLISPNNWDDAIGRGGYPPLIKNHYNLIKSLKMKDLRQISLTTEQIYLIRYEFADRYNQIRQDLISYEHGIKTFSKDILAIMLQTKDNYYEMVQTCNEAIKDCYNPIELEKSL